MTMRNDSRLEFIYIIFFIFSPDAFSIFFWIFRRLRSSLTNRTYCFWTMTRSDSVCIVIKHNRANIAFQLSNTMVNKWFPCRANYYLCFSKSPIQSYSLLAGVYFNTVVRVAEQNRWHGRRPLVDAIMSTCLLLKYSAYWPIYALNTNYIDFTIWSLNTYGITPPQAIRTMPISRELQLARQKSLRRCVPLVHAVVWIYLVWT